MNHKNNHQGYNNISAVKLRLLNAISPAFSVNETAVIYPGLLAGCIHVRISSQQYRTTSDTTDEWR
jgi:hypothetical protein